MHPLGFQTDEKAVRRAGLDYWKHVDCAEHASLEAFDDWIRTEGCRVFALSSHASMVYSRATFRRGDVIVLGKESVGLPSDWVERQVALRIPMVGPTRSLNVANAASVVAYEVLRQVEPSLFE